MVFDAFITTTTQDKILPSVVDSVLGSNPLTLRLMQNPKPWVGETLKVPVKYQKNTNGSSYDGYDTFTTTRVNTRVNMSFNPKAYYQTITLSNMEQGVNDTAKVLDLIGLEMEGAQNDMIDSIGTLMYSDGTGNSSKDFTGLVAAVDDGTNVATYGGLARSTYTTLKANYTASVGNLTLSQMGTMMDSCTVGADKPTLIVTTETVWGYYESLLQPMILAQYDAGGFAQVTANGVLPNRGALKGEAGFDAIFYRGVPMVKDEKCTSGYMYFLNERYLNFYVMPHPKNKAVKPSADLIEGYYSQAGVTQPLVYWSDWLQPTNQDAVTGHLTIWGDLINRNPNRSGVLRGITGV